MSETDDTPTEEELEEKYEDDESGPQYTVDLNGKRYAMNEEWRESIQQRARGEYRENTMFSCWWRVATADDEADPDTVHQEGDPILVIETEGPMVPWEKLDQLELEMQDTSAFDGVDSGSSDVNEGGGMKTIKPGEVQDDNDSEKREKNRTHFGITPQDFQEVPSPEGEDPDKIPPKPQEFDEPKLVFWIPDHPDIDHTWSAGEAIAPMYNWVEWNVQQKANQPRINEDKDNSHDHFESLAKHYDCEKVGELAPKQQPPEPDQSGESGSVKRKGKKSFEDGKYGGSNWNV